MPRRAQPQPRTFPQPFPETLLGKLPGELRNKVYHYALTMPTHTRPEAFPWVYLRKKAAGKGGRLGYDSKEQTYKTNPEYWLGLIRTCQQIYKEAFHIFYEVNRIGFREQKKLVAFSEKFPIRFEFLTSIFINNPDEHPLKLWEALAKCTGLRNLGFCLVCWRHDERWLKQCNHPRVQAVIRSMRGLSHVEFSEEIFIPASVEGLAHLATHDQCPRYGCPHDDMFYQRQDRINIAEKMRNLLLRPKLITYGVPQPKTTSNALQEISPNEAGGKNVLKRKRELTDSAGEGNGQPAAKKGSS
ncbi:MAG: hypothetical protein L6R41_005496 [Letrouitia leprolyta]|nr:MAG: hypothetical protein L6R41_005496 [Letrouitia leprolyta]